jgi:phosphate transport system permease protein
MSAVTPAVSLKPSGGLRRRQIVNKLMELVGWASALAAVGVLFVVIISVLIRAWPALNLDFFTKAPSLFGPVGGISSAIIGSAIIVGLATLFSLPVGVLAAIYLAEFANAKVAGAIQLALDILNGLPTIITGIFVYGILVIGTGQSAYAGAVALAIVMLPLVARAAQETLRLVPSALREGSLALGVSRWRTVTGVILPTTIGGILTGAVLAVARAAGETAPLLFTCSIFNPAVSTDITHAMPNIPVLIFIYSEQPDQALHEQAWGAALVLMLFVLVSSLLAKALLARSRRKLGR